MKKLRFAAAAAALTALIAVLNVIVLKRDLASPLILTGVAAFLVSGAVWLVASISLMASSAQKSRAFQGINSIIGSVVFLAICVLLYAFAAHSDKEYDLTREGRRSLSPLTIQILEALTEDTAVYGLFTESAGSEVDVARDKTLRFLERAQRYTNHINVEFIDPVREKNRVESLGAPYSSGQGSILVKRGKNQRIINLRGENPRLEEQEFTNALINVLRDSEPKVYFLTGHRERDFTSPDASIGGTVFAQFLQGESYRPQSLAIDLRQPVIPSDCDVLIINGPQADLQSKEIEAIDHYLRGGGRLFIMIDPMLTQGGQKPPRLVFLSWLEQAFGIVVGDDVVISGTAERMGEVELLPNSEAFQYAEVQGQESFEGSFASNHPITRDFNLRIFLNTARSVILKEELPEGVVGQVIIRTLPFAWADRQIVWTLFADDSKKQTQPDPDELQGSIPVGVAVSRLTDAPGAGGGKQRDARIVVFGDSDLASNSEITEFSNGNVNLLMNTMAWLTESEELIAMRPSTKDEQPILLTSAEEKVVSWLSTLGVFQLVILAGLVAWWVRSRYQ